MKVTVKGTVVSALERRSGVSSAGKEWASQDFVIQEAGSEDKIKFNVFGADNLANYNLKVNDEIEATIVVTAREYQGKWFIDARAIHCQVLSASGVSTAAPATSVIPDANPNIGDMPF